LASKHHHPPAPAVHVDTINGQPRRDYLRRVRRGYAGHPDMVVGTVNGHPVAWTGHVWDRRRTCQAHGKDCDCPDRLSAEARRMIRRRQPPLPQRPMLVYRGRVIKEPPDWPPDWPPLLVVAVALVVAALVYLIGR